MLKGPWEKLDPRWQRRLAPRRRRPPHRLPLERAAARRWSHAEKWEGVGVELLDRYKKAAGGLDRRRTLNLTCGAWPAPTARATRLNARARAVRVGGRTLVDLGAPADRPLARLLRRARRQRGFRPIRTSKATDSSRSTPLSRTIAEELLKEIRGRLGFLNDVGLHYLTLDRSAPTLSGGEAQRIRLASQVGAGLVGVLYILDEPSIGLHPRDNDRLIATLQRLRDVGNTVIVVEHDEDTMRAADWLVDFGPGPGVKGGEVVAAGDLADPLEVEGQPHRRSTSRAR